MLVLAVAVFGSAQGLGLNAAASLLVFGSSVSVERFEGDAHVVPRSARSHPMPIPDRHPRSPVLNPKSTRSTATPLPDTQW